MADGADCGDYVDYTKNPGTFTCSVFGGACQSWEFGTTDKSGGRPYQSICMIKPYGHRDGVPNNAYIECVAFVCEGLGKMLLNAGPGNCNSKAPPLSSKESFGAVCTDTTSCVGNDPGCKVGQPGQQDICCWNYTTGEVDNSVCAWPTVCGAVQNGKYIDNNYCSIPCGYNGCDVTSGDCDWYINNVPWLEWITNQSTYSSVVNALQQSKPNKPKSSTPLTPRADTPTADTMFYWCKGYGKFLNMGKTGVYFNYFHFLLTMPKMDSTGKIPIRWSFPQIFQTATMNGGNSELKNQLNMLMSGATTDKREYLEGFVTTLVGSYYTPDEGVQVENTITNATNNVDGLINPLDDENLKMIDKMTITKYYDPDLKIKNPQYNKKVKFTPIQAVMLLQGMHIYGATGNSKEYPYVTMSPGYPWSSTSGTYPFGVFFDGANLGHCVYQSINLCGWNSAQFTQMPTGAGGKKYCNYPEYDYEIVYIADKKTVCGQYFKMLNVTDDLDNYSKYGYILNTKSPQPLDATVMKLSERNVPSTWTGPFPNTKAYGLPADYKYVSDNSKCPYTDEVYNKYPNPGPNKPFK